MPLFAVPIDSRPAFGYTPPMRRTFILLSLLFIPLAASGHPGKTDPYGGHRCLKDCAEWDLLYNEYHLHDKHGRPVKVEKKRPSATRKVRARTAAAPQVMTVPAGTVLFPVQQLPVEAPARPRPVEEEAVLLPLPWALILVLLLWLLYRRWNEDR